MEAITRSVFSDLAEAGGFDLDVMLVRSSRSGEYAVRAGLVHVLIGMRRTEYAEFVMPVSPRP